MNGRSALGIEGEDATARLYEEHGYLVLARNWRCRIGELDLVLARDDVLVFCEVKTRSGAGFGGGYEAVTSRKQAKLRSLAEAFLLATRTSPSSMRFDVASVATAGSGRGATVELFEDAF